MTTHQDTNDRWVVLYRGPLSSCNYACDYCPFGKTTNTRAELADDRAKLERFVEWVGARTDKQIGVLFTPWGEGLIRKHYQEALIALSHMPHVWRASIQTNLTNPLPWTERANLDTLGLWTTFHPTQITRERFVQKCRELDRRGVRYSVGAVGFKDALDELRALRAELAPEVYMWINAYKRDPGYYQEEDLARFEQIDPLFRLNTERHASQGAACRAGHSAFTVDGDGEARRCHFIKEPIGNIYTEGFDATLTRRPCTNDTCGCHIGYVHMDRLKLYDTFGSGVPDRVPAVWPR
jgi:MoaA/NifB/PqqE/SkfB family radical SAM enzyme